MSSVPVNTRIGGDGQPITRGSPVVVRGTVTDILENGVITILLEDAHTIIKSELQTITVNNHQVFRA